MSKVPKCAANGLALGPSHAVRSIPVLSPKLLGREKRLRGCERLLVRLLAMQRGNEANAQVNREDRRRSLDEVREHPASFRASAPDPRELAEVEASRRPDSLSGVVAHPGPGTTHRGSAYSRTMLDHLGIQCADVAKAAAFYDTVLATIGAKRLMEFGEFIGYGVDKPEFWVGPVVPQVEPNRELHIAFAAPDRATVRAFFDAAVGMSAEVLHAPREWPEYHPGYFGAFVRDPDGNNVEAVSHRPE